MIPVEQLDRGREAALADPADAGRPVGDEQDPVGLVDAEPRAQRGVNRSAQAVQVSVPASSVRRVSVAPVPARPLGAVEHEPDLDLELGPGRAVVDHRAVGAHPHRRRLRRRSAPVGMGRQDRLGVGRPAASSAAPSSATQRVELAPPDRPAPQLGGVSTALRVAHLGHQWGLTPGGRCGDTGSRGARVMPVSEGGRSDASPRPLPSDRAAAAIP